MRPTIVNAATVLGIVALACLEPASNEKANAPHLTVTMPN